MKGDVFFDTNILLYAAGRPGRKHAIATDLIAAGGTISVQVLNEFANVARRKLGMAWPAVIDALDAITQLCQPAVPILLSTHTLALQIAGRMTVSVYDSLIIAAALEAKCTTLLSEDMQDGQRVGDRLTIRNPFAV